MYITRAVDATSVKRWAHLHVHEALTPCLALHVQKSGFEDLRVVPLDYRPYVHCAGAQIGRQRRNDGFALNQDISTALLGMMFGHFVGVSPLS